MRIIVTEFRETFQQRACEWCIGSIMFACGIVLRLDGDTFGLPTWGDIPSRVASEDLIGTALVAGGAGRLLALAVNGAAHPTPHIRAWFAATSSLVWLSLWFWTLEAPAHGLVVGILPVLVGFDIWNTLRAVGDAAKADRELKELRSGNGRGP